MNSLRKIRDLTLNKHASHPLSFHSPPVIDEPPELAQGMQDVESIRSQYEGLLINGQMISGAAYDLSRAIQDMASFMLETFAQFLDTEMGDVFNMLSKVQFEISKLLDAFAVHVSQTIITPTEMMMNELQLVQVMKKQYDEKRQAYNETWRELQKGKSSSERADVNQKLELAKEDFKGQVHALGFRLQSLKQGQCNSLITQAARYHSAQMHLFNNGLASVSALEPIMKQVASEKKIDRDLQEGEIVSDGIPDFVEREGYISGNGGESESLTSSSSAFQMLDESEIIFPTASDSPQVPVSSSFYVKDDHVAESIRNEFSMYVLPSPSTAAVRNYFQRKGNEGGVQHDMKQLFSQGPRVDSGIQSSETSLKFERALDERSLSLSGLKNVGLPSSFQKIGRSLSHSGPITHRHSINDRHGNVTQTNMAFHVEQRHPSFESGLSGLRVSHPATSISPADVSPLMNELHKLPLPPSPRLRTTVQNQPPYSVKKSQELASSNSMLTLPLPAPPGLGARSFSIPAFGKDRHGEKERHNNFPFPPPLQSIVLPATTSMLH